MNTSVEGIRLDVIRLRRCDEVIFFVSHIPTLGWTNPSTIAVGCVCCCSELSISEEDEEG